MILLYLVPLKLSHFKILNYLLILFGSLVSLGFSGFVFCIFSRRKARLKKMATFPQLFPSKTIYSFSSLSFFWLFFKWEDTHICLHVCLQPTACTHYIIRNSFEKARCSDARQTVFSYNEYCEKSLLIHVFIVNSTYKQQWNAFKLRTKSQGNEEDIKRSFSVTSWEEKENFVKLGRIKLFEDYQRVLLCYGISV